MVGKTLSHYRIVDELGRGGMGIVYKAEDTKLDRTVAIKVLPPHALTSEDDRARFYREARAAASLTHPNIAVIHEIDEAVPEGMREDDVRPFIAMEYVEGETLADRIAKGPLPLKDAVRIAYQVASGLEAAHEKEIVHRDIKSGNIMLTKKGDAKILDFGLAQTTHSTKLTQLGSTLGTVSFMSPEQARAQEVDGRSDLWSLGVVLYEMVTGRHPFPGEYEQAIVYSILNQDPEPLTALRTGVPMPLEWIVKKLLAKSADDRYQTTKDLLVDLKNVDLMASGTGAFVSAGSGTTPFAGYPPSGYSSGTPILEQPKSRAKNVTIMALVVVALVAGGVLGIQFLNTSEPMLQPVRFVLPTGDMKNLQTPSVSPNGRYVAFATDEVGEETSVSLNIYDFETGEFHIHENADFAEMTSFSPNSEWLVGAWQSSGIHKLRVPDGDPLPLSEDGEGPVWENDSSILYTVDGELYRMDENGQNKELVVSPDSLQGHDAVNCNRSVLPINEQYIVCNGWSWTEYRGDAILVNLQDGSYETVIQTAIPSIYIPTGHIIFGLGGGTSGKIAVQRFDIGSRKTIGPVVPLDFNEHVWRNWTVGRDGTLVYQECAAGSMWASCRPGVRLAWFDRSLGEIDVGEYSHPRISPDGNLIVYESAGNIAILNLETGLKQTLVSGGFAKQPIWAPDGNSIIYIASENDSDSEDKPFRIAANGSGIAQPISLPDENIERTLVSPDGKWLAYRVVEGLHVYLGKFASNTVQNADSLDRGTPYGFSPDSRYFVWQRKDPKAIVVTDLMSGGIDTCCEGFWVEHIEWMMDGQSIWIMDRDGNVYRIPIDVKGGFRFLSEPELIANIGGGSEFTVDPKSGEVLVAEKSTNPLEDKFMVIQNWTTELMRIVPVDR